MSAGRRASDARPRVLGLFPNDPRQRLILALGWIAAGLLAALTRFTPPRERDALGPPSGRLADSLPPLPEEAAAPQNAAAAATWHEPVVVVAEWLHTPVRVLAAAPARGRAAAPDWRRELPRPLARLRDFASPLLAPRLGLERVLRVDFPALRGLAARARPGQAVQVRLTAYCLTGRTRRGTRVRPGVVAADLRLFPMARQLELFAAGRYLGRFRVEDTGSGVRGPHIDIWTPDCADARRFGSRAGVATLVAPGDR